MRAGGKIEFIVCLIFYLCRPRPCRGITNPAEQIVPQIGLPVTAGLQIPKNRSRRIANPPERHSYNDFNF